MCNPSVVCPACSRLEHMQVTRAQWFEPWMGGSFSNPGFRMTDRLLQIIVCEFKFTPVEAPMHDSLCLASCHDRRFPTLDLRIDPLVEALGELYDGMLRHTKWSWCHANFGLCSLDGCDASSTTSTTHRYLATSLFPRNQSIKIQPLARTQRQILPLDYYDMAKPRFPLSILRLTMPRLTLRAAIEIDPRVVIGDLIPLVST
jgi:hypothetical protein